LTVCFGLNLSIWCVINGPLGGTHNFVKVKYCNVKFRLVNYSLCFPFNF
jgi:hypothetical protein